jgi:hypothetical protein
MAHPQANLEARPGFGKVFAIILAVALIVLLTLAVMRIVDWLVFWIAAIAAGAYAYWLNKPKTT